MHPLIINGNSQTMKLRHTYSNIKLSIQNKNAQFRKRKHTKFMARNKKRIYIFSQKSTNYNIVNQFL